MGFVVELSPVVSLIVKALSCAINMLQACLPYPLRRRRLAGGSNDLLIHQRFLE